ncbi:hypothetical protein AWB78_08321 [Caballeronia calidae]|uniref:Uncharacterized protein n=1 Tax=Caballeronia calidae TaxID=1777139 RepID=A0A158EJG6_9BURK|nr:hypothetical protein [Caballeronia calidae]SAL06923.1 hypothetical protein AWB78_08321 [Caballeronia calidae]
MHKIFGARSANIRYSPRKPPEGKDPAVFARKKVLGAILSDLPPGTHEINRAGLPRPFGMVCKHPKQVWEALAALRPQGPVEENSRPVGTSLFESRSNTIGEFFQDRLPGFALTADLRPKNPVRALRLVGVLGGLHRSDNQYYCDELNSSISSVSRSMSQDAGAFDDESFYTGASGVVEKRLNHATESQANPVQLSDYLGEEFEIEVNDEHRTSDSEGAYQRGSLTVPSLRSTPGSGSEPDLVGLTADEKNVLGIILNLLQQPVTTHREKIDRMLASMSLAERSGKHLRTPSKNGSLLVGLCLQIRKMAGVLLAAENLQSGSGKKVDALYDLATTVLAPPHFQVQPGGTQDLFHRFKGMCDARALGTTFEVASGMDDQSFNDLLEGALAQSRLARKNSDGQFHWPHSLPGVSGSNPRLDRKHMHPTTQKNPLFSDDSRKSPITPETLRDKSGTRESTLSDISKKFDQADVKKREAMFSELVSAYKNETDQMFSNAEKTRKAYFMESGGERGGARKEGIFDKIKELLFGWW